MYEAVDVRPAGESTAARAALTAAEYGFDGIVVRTREVPADAVPDRYGVDAVDGATLDPADPPAASVAVRDRRPDHELLLLSGGTAEIDRFAVEEPRVDVLVGPDVYGSAPSFDHVTARAAASNGVRVEFDLGPVLRSTGSDRVRAIRGLRYLHRLVTKYDTPHVVSAVPATHLQLRAPRELAAVGEAVGLSAEFVRDGLREWGRLAERNRDRAGDDWVLPGVRRGRHGTHEAGDAEGRGDDPPPDDATDPTDTTGGEGS